MSEEKECRDCRERRRGSVSSQDSSRQSRPVQQPADGENGGVEPQVGYKRDRKKKYTREEQMAFWKTKKEEKKARDKQKREEKAARDRAEWEALTEEEREERRRKAVEIHSLRRAQEEKAHEQRLANLASDEVPTLLFDVSFEHIMKEADLRSTMQQLKFSYSTLRRHKFCLKPAFIGWGAQIMVTQATVAAEPAEKPAVTTSGENIQRHRRREKENKKGEPVQFNGTVSVVPRTSNSDDSSTTGGSEEEQQPSVSTGASSSTGKLVTTFEGFRAYSPIASPLHWSQWAPEGSALRDRLVYLTADSTTVLEKLEPDGIYIVGCFVDHNAQKGLTNEIARQYSLRTARLPLQETLVRLGNTCKVLTINHVTELLAVFQDTGSWLEACQKVLPRRNDEQQGEQQQEGEEKDQLL